MSGAEVAAARAARLAKLSPAKRHLLLSMLARDEAAATAIPRRAERGTAPLSFAQQRLWFLDRLVPGTAAYNLPFAARVRGPLRAGVLARALAAVIDRHEVLRGTFAPRPGTAEPVQTIAPRLAPPLPLVDLGALAPDPALATGRELSRQEARRPFDLSRGPLVRALLLRLAPDDHLLLVTAHHVVSDGWSAGNLARETAALYEAFATDRPSPLPPLPIQYGDYAAWQRAWLRGERLEAQLGYWRRQLAGAPDLLELPADRPRPAVQSFRGAVARLALDAELAGRLRRRGRERGTTLFVTLLAAFQALTGRYSGQTDVVVGTPVAGRTRPELEPLIGCFVNMLALRADLSTDLDFGGLLDQASATSLAAFTHQDLPFEKLVDELGVARSLSRGPLVQVVFGLNNAPLAELRLGSDLRLDPLGWDNGSAKFDLTLSLAEIGGALAGSIEYATDLFDAATVARLGRHFARLLDAVAADPARRIWEIPLLDAAERHQLLAEWGGRRGTWPRRGLYELFAEQARATPAAVAAVCGGESMTYGELLQQAQRVAHRLLAAGVRPGERVGLCVERSLETVAAVIGILAAGCAYLPLDPAQPAERLAFMLADAGARVALADPDSRHRLAAATAATLLPVEVAAAGAADGPAAAFGREPALGLGPEWPVYVIYTSGSTGRPKGVVVTHGNVSRLFAASASLFDFGPRDVWTLFHSCTFDFSVWEIWGALLYGGRLVVVPYWVSRSPAEMHALVRREGVTVLNQTPSAFRQLGQAVLAAPSGGAPLPLRWVIFGGEALEPRSLARWWTHFGGGPDGGPRLVNMYGITETTVHVTFRRLTHADVAGAGGSGIGLPLPDLAAHVLDRGGRPLPVGVPGELYVGGAGVAMGYLGRPELTAERFVPDPFAPAAGRAAEGGGEAGGGQRLYRTGDLVRWRAAGGLEYLGRIDRQVKIRGFRIELGEIETALAACPGVGEAVVLAREDQPGERRLVAYLTAAAGAAPGAEELRRRLAERLPEHMLPAAFVELAALPLTPNGKLDRGALPAPGSDRPELDTAYAPPGTPLEATLCEVWSRSLGIERVGVHDNFFALGGDSILSLQVLALAAERGVELALADLFRHPTVAELAARLAAVPPTAATGEGAAPPPAAGAAAPALPARGGRLDPFALIAAVDRERLPAGLDDACPLAELQAGMLYHMALTPEEPLYHNVDSWHLAAHFDGALFAAALAQTIARHPALRTSFDLKSFSEPLQLVHREVELPLVIADLRHLEEAEQEACIEALVASEKRLPFAPDRAPQLRFHVHVRSAETFQLTLAENHAVLDGWSLHATLAEIFERYFALLAGEEPAAAPPPALSYADFVAAERQALASPEAEAFWSGRLEGVDEAGLAPWRHRPPPAGRRTRGVTVPMSRELTARLQALARQAAVPLKSVLLAAHLKALSLITGRAALLSGLAANGRLEEAGGDEIRGLFLNVLPLRFTVTGCTWRELAQAALAAEEEMLPFRRYPFAAVQRRRGGAPLLDVLFNYIHFHVLKGLQREGRIDVLGSKRAEGGSFKLLVNFSRNLDGTRLALELEYDSHALPRAQVESMAGHYARVLEAMAAGPAERHDARSLLSPEAAHLLLVERHPPAAELPVTACLHELFAAQARRRPDAAAVSAGGATLSYGELDRRVWRLAGRLRALGVGPEVLVALHCERSLAMVEAILGVLTAGGAYLPLDPAHPGERLRFMLEDSGARLLIADSATALPPGLLALDGVAAVSLSELAAGPAAGEEHAAGAGGALPDHAAYVIYTSGSTGRPKGVVVTHANVCRLFTAAAGWFGFSAEDAWTLLHSYAFDFSVWEMWGAFLHGGRLVVVPYPVSRSPAELALLMRREGITVLSQTPAAFRHLLAAEEAAPAGAPLALRAVVFGGEALDPAMLRSWFARHGDRRPRLINMYGITETTVHVTWRPLAAADAARPGSVIGRPLADLRLYLLDPHGQPVPPGVAGEIHVAGAGLARGYLRRPELTAARFVPDPFGSPGGRLYRSGDLARLLPDGDLEFLGRVDHQVKLRGFRIELGEIEAALLSYPRIREAAVLLREDSAGDRRLVAYLVGALPPPSVQELREHARRRLPEYMVPAAFVLLPLLPLTANGKLDRRALPAPEAAPAATAEADVAPRTPVEEIVAGIWAEVLHAEHVSIADSFFDLGGHSLLMGRIAARLRAAFAVEVPLGELFATPTVASQARRIEQARRRAEAAAPPIVPAPRGERLPLSFAQQRLWFIDQLAPGSPLYNIPVALAAHGELHPHRLARCLEEVARRHEALRTVFAAVGGEPEQRIVPPAVAPLPVVDLAGLPPLRRRRLAAELAAAEAARPFDLARGPLWRAALLRLDEQEHLALLTLHHIAGDGWSMEILVREISALYTAFTAGRPSPLGEPPAVQYADFALWQRRWLAGEALAGQLAFWRQRLAGLPALELPLDRPRPAIESPAGAVCALTLPQPLAAQLAALARGEQATLFMVLLSGFAALLARHSGQADFAVGTVTAGRTRVEVEELIGCFVNTLVLRADLSGAPAGRELIGRCRETVLAAHGHQELPFEKLVEEIEPRRDLGRSPLFQVLFELQHGAPRPPELPGLRLRNIEAPSRTAKFDLSLAVGEREGEMIAAAEYRTALWDEATVRRLLAQWRELLAALATAPAQPVEQLGLLSAAERHQLLREWNDSAAPLPAGGFLAAFAAQAAARPQAPAVSRGAETATYDQLDRRAAHLAGQLARELAGGQLAGRRPGGEPVIALLAERGVDLVASILALWRTGAAYLPLDPQQPAPRLRQLLEQSRSPITLAARPLLPLLAEATAGMAAAARPRALTIEELLARPPAAGAPAPAGEPGRLAYVIYTSGSTGAPKGAMVEHRGLFNHLLAKVRALGLTAADVVAQTASQGFDISVWQLLAPLLAGGRVAVVLDEEARDPHRLLAALEAAAVTVVELVPAVLRELLAEIGPRRRPGALAALRWMIPTGEALPPALCRDWLAAFPAVPLLNAYGPTECSDDVTHQVIAEAPARPQESAPIGRPVPNLRLHVLDHALQPAPLGAVSELWVGGAGVGRGYLHDAARTAAAFLPDPWAEEPGQRLYRTGDLARHAPGGELLFLGRGDHQVKIRGHRIELGEVEAALGLCPGVAQVVVVARGEAADRHLVAYLVAAPGVSLDAEQARVHLRERLPAAMVPASFVLLDTLPLTPNGKVDRRALPAPAAAAPAFVAPAGPVAELLAAIWADLLDREQVGATDDFFALGGHSLLATRLLSRLRAAFGVELPLRAIFEEPVLGAQAARLERELRTAGAVALPPLVTVARGGALPLSFAQQRLWVIDQLDPGSPLYNVPVALRVSGPLAAGVLAASLGAIVRRHEALRTVFPAVDGVPGQLILPAAPPALPLVDLAALPAPAREAAAARLVAAEARASFDLAAGPLLRVRLLRLGDRDHVVLLTLHHIVSDGWSLEILVREVAALYRAAAENRPDPLPPLPVQYADFAAWQRGWLRGELLETQLAYWRGQLAGLPPVQPLPLDRPRPPVRSFRGATRALRLAPEVAGDLRRLGRERGATLFMTLLAGFQALLARWSGTTDVVVGTPIAGRHQLGLEPLIGFFVNTLVLRTELAGVADAGELVGRVREAALAAYLHQDLPFEKLVDEIQPERSLAHSPLFQVLFLLQQTGARLAIEDLALATVPSPAVTAKFDLTLAIEPHGEELRGGFEYSAELFDGTTAARLCGHLENLLGQVAADPARPLAELVLLSPAERHQLGHEWRGGTAAPAAGSCLHELFAAQARRRPAAVAVRCAGRELTYGELARRSARLAGRLRRRGLAPGEIAGLHVERSLEMVVAILAVLEAGGAYLPLDPALPAERLAFLLADAAPRLVLSTSELAPALPRAAAGAVVLLDDEEGAGVAGAPAAAPAVTGDFPAYVIYTSGSTGKPKGVVVTHDNVVRLFAATAGWFDFDERDVWTLFHSFAFDFSVWELWGPLLAGGRLVVVPHLVSRSPGDFYELLREEGVTVLNQTPTAFRQLVRWENGLAEPADLRLRLVVFGGEALELESLRPWIERHGDRRPRLVNMYGITETTVHVTYRPLDRADLARPVSPIGRPIPDLETLILDPTGAPAPIGAPGELHVAGRGLAWGYLGRPELTAERFVPHPFAERPGARVYRSGDLARYRADGDIEYLGRRDQQVKVRGFRIELREIEAALLEHPRVADCAVVARDGEARSLVAYLVARPGQEAEPRELRRWLAERLPEYMLPAAFVPLAALPLTPNGKLDSAALPAPAAALEALEQTALPATAAERALVEVTAELLDQPRVGVLDSFFGLGGDSILAIRLVALARQRGLEVSLQEVFRQPSLRELARVAAAAAGAAAEPAAAGAFSQVSPEDLARLPPGLEDAYPLSSLQAGMIFHGEYENLYHNVSRLHLSGVLDPAALERALARLAARHPVLRTSFDLERFGEPLQLVHREAAVPLLAEDLRALGPAEQDAALAASFTAALAGRFDLSRPPLLRFAAFRRDEQSFELMWAEHHAILDGWSVASLLAELFALYRHEGGQGEAPPPPPPNLFREFVALERRTLADAEARRFWHHALAGRPSGRLPRWSPAPAAAREGGAAPRATLEVPLPGELAVRLREQARALEVPLKSLLLAAHLEVLAFLCGSADVITGLVANGRPEIDGGDRALGLFLNTVPLRLRLAPGTWRGLVEQVFATEREMTPHRRYPLAELQRALGGQPLFEAAFTFVHFHALDAVARDGAVEVLGEQAVADTNFMLAVNFSLDLSRARLDLALAYDATVFPAAQVRAFAGYYRRALAALAADPSRPRLTASLLSAVERQQLAEWNVMDRAWPSEAAVHELFAAQARRTADSVAIAPAGAAAGGAIDPGALTYGELDRRSAELARRLAGAGVGPDSVVALYLERSPELVVAVLGVLRAGGAYLPLDLAHPAARLRYMLEDSHAALVLTRRALRAPAGALGGPPALCLDEAAPEGSAPAAPPRGPAPDNLAYVIYTSGSTGQPKGVMITHRGLANYLLWALGAYGAAAGSGAPLHSPLGFDLTVTSLFLPLLCGRRLLLIDEGTGIEPLARALAAGGRDGAGFSLVKLTPAHLELLARTLPAGAAPGCTRRLVIGGEALLWGESVAYWRRHAPATRLINEYGPTETVVGCCVHELAAGEPEQGAVPIGRPIANTRLHALDGDLWPVPVGTAGELHVGGAGLARGYLGRPELTASRFLPDPLGEPGERLYATGDLVRRRPDGVLEFLGRTDHQVKVRGFRIEPGEVEAALAAHPAVAGAAVAVHEGTAGEPGDRRLVAYVVAATPPAPPPAELRAFLAERLPAAMVPALYVELPELPLTANGKVDRTALPAPPAARPDLGVAYTPPRTPVEEAVVAIWSDILGTTGVGAHDDFFALGGHSLLATRVVARLRSAFQIELPLQELFERPTVAALAREVERAVALAAGSGAAAPPPILPLPAGAEAPLSYAQERLWLIDQLAPASALYNMPIALRVAGPLRPAALAAALAAVASRHQVLRTLFPASAGEPRPRVLAAAPPPLPMVDLSGLPPERREALAAALAGEEARRPFDLARRPAWRVALLRLGEALHVALLTLHHIAGDGWSISVLVRELSALYAAGAAGRRSALPPLPIQYGDFAHWQRQWLRGEALARQLEYWRAQLAGAPALLELPTDRPRPPVQGARGGEHAFVLGPELGKLLRAASRREGVTLFMVLLAAFQTLLGRHAGRLDVSVGTPIAGRTQGETEDLIGFFVNTLVLRADLARDPTFAELLARTRERALGAYAHQDLPFEKLVEELAPARSLAHSPLFQVMLVLQNTPAAELAAAGLELRRCDAPLQGAKFDLTLGVAGDGDGLRASFEYRADLFDRATVARLAAQFQSLLAAAARAPESALSALPLLGEAERHQLLQEWNDSAATPATEPWVHEQFATAARRRPAALAVSGEGGELSYGELAHRAAALARELQRRGVGPEVRVAVALERSPELVVALLAVLAAGGAYVPFDLSYPPERLDSMLADCGAAALLTRAALRPLLAGFAGEVVCLDEGGVPPEATDRGSQAAAGAAVIDAAPPEARVSGDNLAYVIYTSGSTGSPKGVAITHRCLANLVAWHRRAFAVSSADRASHLASLGFDASVWELWPYLAAGASLHLASEETRRSPAALRGWIAAREITICFAPTPLAEGLLDLGWPPSRRLRLLLTGGDRLRLPRPVPRGRRLVNNYGPTESTVVALSGEVGAELATGTLPPLGRPVANTRVHLLDTGLQPVPIGAPGEICLAGDGLARGYLGRPEWTAERFVPDPWSPEPGGRLYRTGDLARRRPDGDVDFLSRRDRQVKLRGFRVELGEIEAALRRLPEVADAAVLARHESAGDRLEAYVVARPAAGVAAAAAAPPAPGELRAALARVLPDYMVPALFVQLAALPLTPNGKLDRESLAMAGDEARRDRAAAGLRPPNATADLVAAVWCEVLGVEQAASGDDFFAAGGHSLLATRLLARLAAVTGVELPLRDLFAAPTVGALARRLEEAVRQSAAPALPPLRPAARGPAHALPLSFAQQRLWVLDQLAPDTPLYNVPLAWRLAGRLDPALLSGALAAVVRRHEALRTVFAEAAGEPRQVVLPPRRVALPVVDLAGLPAARQEPLARSLAATEAARLFDLRRGPLLRATLLRLGPDDQVLLLTLHHIVCDGWSLRLLAAELAELYRAAAAGEAPRLPELPVQYADYARWQRGWLRGERLAGELDFWRHRLAGLPPLLALPTDRPRRAVQGVRGAARAAMLPPALAAELAAAGRREGATMYMVLFAAWAALLGRHAAVDRVAVGTPVAGRSRLEIEPLIGFFVNTLVLRGDLSGDPGARDLVRRVREELVTAHAHQELPFERLIEEISPERSLSHSPLFQVMFTLQEDEAAPRLGALQARSLAVPAATAKFDLTLAIERAGAAVHCGLQYSTDLFDAATAARLLDHLGTLLAAMAADPALPVTAAPLLRPREMHQLCREWNDSAAPIGEPCVHELAAARAARRPRATALVSDAGRLSYGELAAWSRGVARRLVERGAGPETRVAVCLPRSPALVAAVWGVLEAGACFVPLDPAQPAERLAFMLADCGAPLLLTSGELAPRQIGFRGEVLLVETAPPAAAAEIEARWTDRRALPENLAYVIYTSGSTGRPKGVEVSHRALRNLVDWHMRAYRLSAADRATQVASPGFDAAVWEIWPYLAAGAEIHLPPDELRLDATLLRDRLLAEGITCAFLPTPLAEAALRLDWPASAPLRVLLTGGDRLRARPRAGMPFALVNHYGPTESAVVATCGAVASRPEGGAGPTIGRPIANTRVLLLDPGLAPVPPGAAGEIYIGGAGLARGYLGRADLTAERFVPDPAGAEPGARLYRTGDLARHLPDGRLDFLGRNDGQVKVRGVRVEIGEVEAALAAHPSVEQAAVVATEHGEQRRLVGFVALAGSLGAAGSPGAAPVELRRFLAERLPEAMVPADLIALTALPLTPNGKLDRRALERAAAAAPTAGAPRADALAPRDGIELALTRIWEELLDRRPIGVRDGFFDRGGHSLLAVALLARIEADLGTRLPLTLLFQEPTVEAVAAELRRRRGGAPTARGLVEEIQRGDGRPPLVLVHAAGGDVFCYVPVAAALGAEQPVLALRARGLEPGESPLTSIEEMAEQYLAALRAERRHGPWRLGGWSMGGMVAWEMARRLAADGEEVELLALLDTWPAAAPAASADALLAAFAEHLGVPSEEVARRADPDLARLDRAGKLALLLAAARQQGLLPPDLPPDQFARWFEVFAAGARALAAYHPPPLRSPVTFFRAAGAAAGARHDPRACFGPLATGGLAVHDVAGDHFTLLRPPHVGALAQALAGALAGAAEVER